MESQESDTTERLHYYYYYALYKLIWCSPDIFQLLMFSLPLYIWLQKEILRICRVFVLTVALVHVTPFALKTFPNFSPSLLLLESCPFPDPLLSEFSLIFRVDLSLWISKAHCLNLSVGM